MIKFEKVSRFADDAELALPCRKTKNSAGYDFVVAEDTIVPAYPELLTKMRMNTEDPDKTFSLEEVSQIVKKSGAKPTLVSTGMKCALDPDSYLELSVRSSTPLKNWLILANGVGIIDADYYNNPDNEGEIFFQIINLFPYSIELHKGDRIGQGVIKPYLVTDDDSATGIRTGGFGSTSKTFNSKAEMVNDFISCQEKKSNV